MNGALQIRDDGMMEHPNSMPLLAILGKGSTQFVEAEMSNGKMSKP